MKRRGWVLVLVGMLSMPCAGNASVLADVNGDGVIDVIQSAPVQYSPRVSSFTGCAYNYNGFWYAFHTQFWTGEHASNFNVFFGPQVQYYCMGSTYVGMAVQFNAAPGNTYGLFTQYGTSNPTDLRGKSPTWETSSGGTHYISLSTMPLVIADQIRYWLVQYGHLNLPSGNSAHKKIEWWNALQTSPWSSAPHSYGMESWKNPYLADNNIHDKILRDAVARRIVDVKTTVHGPLTPEEAATMNDRLATGESVLNNTIGIGVGIGLWLGRVHGLVSVLAGAATVETLPPPARDRVREGDILVISAGIVYGSANSGIPKGSFVEVRIINQNLVFINDTGMTVFQGKEADVLYNVSADVENRSSGVRIYLGSDGKIRFEPIPPP
jgi:hypothetical protein